MNKETRIFIWGIIVFISCATGFAIHLSEIMNNTWKVSGWNAFLFIGTTLGMISGSIDIFRTIK